MAFFAVGPLANDRVTIQQVVRAGLESDLPTVPTGYGRYNVTALIGSDDPNSFRGRVLDVSDTANLSFIAATQQEIDAQSIIALKERLFIAVRGGFSKNLPHWPDLRDGITKENPRQATNKWIYHTTALIDLMIDGQFRNSANTIVIINNIEEVVVHWEDIMSQSVQAWYDTVAAPGGTAAAWITASVADGAAIYSDALAVNTGAIRTIDGAFTLFRNNAIPVNFTTETSTLRMAA